MNRKREWSPGELLKVSGSYWESCTLHAGVKLGVFTALGTKKMRSEDVARDLGCDARATKVLMNALAAMGLLIKKGEKYENTALCRSLLVKGSPQYLGHMIMHHHHMVETWARLPKAVSEGKPMRMRADPTHEEREAFLMGMFNVAMAIAPALAKQVDLRGKKHLLDLGGGPGTYAIHFCLENSDLRGTVFDLSGTAPFAKETIKRFGVSDRVDFLTGNYLKDDIPGTYDVAWLSQILHGEGPAACQMIVNKAVSILEPGGLLLIHEFILNDTFDGPLFPAVFSLNMLVNTDSGRSYSERELRGMMAEAGLRDITRLPFTGPMDSGVLAGVL